MLTKTPKSQIKPWSIFFSLFLAGLILAGCTLPSPSTSTQTLIPPSPTPILPSPTPLVPLNTPTAIPPTQTPLLTVTPTSVPGVINFTLGTTAAVETGTVQPGQVISYTISADQLQPMILILESPNADVTLGVFEPNGNILLDPAKKWNRWQAWLPKTEIYTIQVNGGASSENYTLTVKVAQLVKFASGVTSITLSGPTINGFVFSYTC